MVTIGKPMGNGHPISAVVTTSEIAMKFVEAEGLESLEEVNKLRRMGLLRWHIGPSENLGMNQGNLPDCRVGRWVVEGEGGEGKRIRGGRGGEEEEDGGRRREGGEGREGRGNGEGNQRRTLQRWGLGVHCKGTHEVAH